MNELENLIPDDSREWAYLVAGFIGAVVAMNAVSNWAVGVLARHGYTETIRRPDGTVLTGT